MSPLPKKSIFATKAQNPTKKMQKNSCLLKKL